MWTDGCRARTRTWTNGFKVRGAAITQPGSKHIKQVALYYTILFFTIAILGSGNPIRQECRRLVREHTTRVRCSRSHLHLVIQMLVHRLHNQIGMLSFHVRRWLKNRLSERLCVL